MTDITVIINPRAHRRAENDAQQRDTAPLPDGWFLIDMPPLDEDEWFCDFCNATIDPDETVVAVGTNALCAPCASPVIARSGLVRVGAEYLVPVCACRGCTPTTEATSSP